MKTNNQLNTSKNGKLETPNIVKEFGDIKHEGDQLISNYTELDLKMAKLGSMKSSKERNSLLKTTTRDFFLKTLSMLGQTSSGYLQVV